MGGFKSIKKNHLAITHIPTPVISLTLSYSWLSHMTNNVMPILRYLPLATISNQRHPLNTNGSYKHAIVASFFDTLLSALLSCLNTMYTVQDSRFKNNISPVHECSPNQIAINCLIVTCSTPTPDRPHNSNNTATHRGTHKSRFRIGRQIVTFPTLENPTNTIGHFLLTRSHYNFGCPELYTLKISISLIGWLLLSTGRNVSLS